MQPCISPVQIQTRIDGLAARIRQSEDSIDICAVLMDGAMIFAADLLRALYNEGVDPKTVSLRLSSYGDAREMTGAVRVTANIEADLNGAHVLIVDDVLDSGNTLDFARRHILALGAAKVSTCVFAQKPYAGRKTAADYTGWEAPDAFLVGYGLDDARKKRGLPGIWRLD